MASNKPSIELSEYQRILNSRIFDLVISRVLRAAYLNLDEENRANAKKIFLSEPEGYPDKEKENFIKKYIPNFKKLFEQEAKKIENEIKAEIEKQI